MKKILGVLVVLATLVGSMFANDRFVNIKDYDKSPNDVVYDDKDLGIVYDDLNKTVIYYDKCVRFTAVHLRDKLVENIDEVLITKDKETFSNDLVEMIDYMVENNITTMTFSVDGYMNRLYIMDDVFIYYRQEE